MLKGGLLPLSLGGAGGGGPESSYDGGDSSARLAGMLGSSRVKTLPPFPSYSLVMSPCVALEERPPADIASHKDGIQFSNDFSSCLRYTVKLVSLARVFSESNMSQWIFFLGSNGFWGGATRSTGWRNMNRNETRPPSPSVFRASSGTSRGSAPLWAMDCMRSGATNTYKGVAFRPRPLSRMGTRNLNDAELDDG